MEVLAKELKERGANDIELIDVEIPEGTQLKEGETRTYIHVKGDYMLPTGGTMNGTPGVKFEIIREDVGLVTEVIVIDGPALQNLRDILIHVINEQVNKTGMYT